MSAKYFANSGLNYIPQMDFEARDTENGGIEASQSFLIRQADVGVGPALNNFTRGVRLEVIHPYCPALYRNLTLKHFPITDHAPGWMKVSATFTGYAFSTTAGSSGTEPTVPTTSLVPSLEEAPLNEHSKWKALSFGQRYNLNLLQTNHDGIIYNLASDQYGRISDTDVFIPLIGASFTPTGDEIMFARLLGQGKTTYKRAAWSYSYRTEGSEEFTSAQLNKAGKIVASPLGNPKDPGAGWTWMLIGPTQEQSGPDRFYKTLDYALIEDNDENQFLYSD